jgi:hypothetical protein
VDQYLFASRALVLAAPIMFAQVFCRILIMLSTIEVKIWTGVNIIARPGRGLRLRGLDPVRHLL